MVVTEHDSFINRKRCIRCNALRLLHPTTLALGLASLSSNRGRVESLFIDEGFGSLDAVTLRVAMDALDGLQAMGRKVGVISHVQEMTERIVTKVLVERVAGGSSRVGIS